MQQGRTQWVLTGISEAGRLARGERALVTLDWPDSVAHDPWLALLLPTRAYNQELARALDGLELPPGAYVGVFLAHPYLEMEGMIDRVRAAGAAGIAAMPGITRLSGPFGSVAEVGGLSIATEWQRLAIAADRGLETMATLGAPGCGVPPVALAPDWVLTAPGVPVDAVPDARRGLLEYRPASPAARPVSRLELAPRRARSSGAGA